MHKIRKTYASTLLHNGVNLSIVKDMLGHADELTTLKHYIYNIEDININKEYVSLVKSGFTHLLNGTQIKNILWSSEIIYYIINHSDITQHEIQEILLMEEILVLFQNGPVEQLSEILYRCGSYDLIRKYSEWLGDFIKSKNI